MGEAILPENVIDRVCGGVAMGVGFALMEEIEQGRTTSMKDYHFPTRAEMLEVTPIIIEAPDYKLSDIFNTQVFLTSHGKECVDAFVMNIPNTEDLTCHALVEEENDIVARQFSGSKFRRLVEVGNVDLRLAR